MRRDAPGGVIADKSQIFKAFSDIGCVNQEPEIKKNVALVKPIKGQIRRFFSWKLDPQGKSWGKDMKE